MDHFYRKIDGWFDFEDVYSKVVDAAPSTAHFVEVGAFKGKSTAYMAVEIVNSKKSIRFDVIDTWRGSEEHQAGREHARSAVTTQTLYQDFLENMQPVIDIINPIQTTSLEAATRYADRTLDFVFIDASHDYENVAADIRAWRSKVRSGGFLGGHDYQALFPGVIKAVTELVPGCEIRKFSWLIRLP